MNEMSVTDRLKSILIQIFEIIGSQFGHLANSFIIIHNKFNIKKIDNTGNMVNVYSTDGSYIDYSLTQSLTSRGTNLAVQTSTTQYWIL